MNEGPTASTCAEAPLYDIEMAVAAKRAATALFGDAPAVPFGRYFLLERVGAGGMGIVYSAFDPNVERKVAIKVLHPRVATEGARLRLVREAKALGRLAHPNVVVVHDADALSHRGRAQVFVVMEFVAGSTLGSWRAQPRRPADLLDVLLQAGRGLVAAHAAGLVHRDFKPDNIMISEATNASPRRVRVMDFGVAQLADERGGGITTDGRDSSRTSLEESGVTRSGDIVGTWQYMAPEQLRGAEVDARADQFAFSVVVWEALSGSRPFQAPTPASLCAAIEARELSPPLHGRVPRWLRGPLLRGLAARASDRFSSLEALLAALATGRRRARARVIAIAVAVLAAGGVAAQSHHHIALARTASACEASGSEVELAWNPRLRAAVRGSLLATRAGNAETTATKVMPWLDRQAQAWADARIEACKDTELRGRWDAETLERALWCLEERHNELSSLVEQLSDADAVAVQSAVPAAAGLASTAGCSDRRFLEALALPPSEQREPIRRVRAELVRSRNLQRGGAYKPSLMLARDALARARELGWAPLTASAQLRVGEALEPTAQYREAAAVLEEAYFAAADGVDPKVAADAAAGLVDVVGVSLARYEEARRWSRHATVALAGVPDPAELDRARLLERIGTLDRAAGAHQDALTRHQQALDLRLRALGSEHLEVARSLTNIAAVHTISANYDAAEELYREALAIFEQTLGADHPEVATILTNIADIHRRKGHLDTAAAFAEQALAIHQRALGSDHPSVALALTNLGNIAQVAGRYEEARSRYERALTIWEHAKGPRHPDVATAVNNLANLDFVRRDFDRAEPLYLRSLAIWEEALGPNHPHVATNLSNLGSLHGMVGRHELAMQEYRRALRIWEHNLGPDHPDVAAGLTNLAIVYETVGQFEDARALLDRALDIRERALGPDHADLGYTLHELALVSTEQKRFRAAIGFAERALQVWEASKSAPSNLAETRFLLAQVLWSAEPDEGRDRARALSLAHQAHDAFGAEHLDAPGAAVEQWLRGHEATASTRRSRH